MTTKDSRLAVLGADALAANSAHAADTVRVVDAPLLSGAAAKITPKSVHVNRIVDTSGTQCETFALPACGVLSWSSGFTSWNATTSAGSCEVDGIPHNGATTMAGIPGGSPATVSTTDAENFSSVGVAYDTLNDYQKSGDAPGPAAELSTDANVSTAAGFLTVTVPVGAFDVAAQPGRTSRGPARREWRVVPVDVPRSRPANLRPGLAFLELTGRARDILGDDMLAVSGIAPISCTS